MADLIAVTQELVSLDLTVSLTMNLLHEITIVGLTMSHSLLKQKPIPQVSTPEDKSCNFATMKQSISFRAYLNLSNESSVIASFLLLDKCPFDLQLFHDIDKGTGLTFPTLAFLFFSTSVLG